MAVIKVACPKCGQKVSGDETFYGRKVNCPICTSRIVFPDNPGVPSTPAPPSSTYEPVPPAGGSPVPPSTAHQEPAFETIVPGGASAPVPPASGPVPPASSAGQPPLMDEAPPQAGLNAAPGYPPSSPPSYPEPPRRDEPPMSYVPMGQPGVNPETTGEAPGSPLPGVITLILGILACLGGGMVFAPLTIILGHIFLSKMKHQPNQPAPGQKLAKIGLILGYAGLVLTILILLVLLLTKNIWMPKVSPGG